ncbi:hypothetical protein [Paraburkholderia dilworthii]|uniref:hypothetical protein n=1 Tax=Paraburkholderia dilworthii TaxID=948106 RepID=UPI0012693B57|nr:hypothetical protein [Paraburkholderia dilworthii]
MIAVYESLICSSLDHLVTYASEDLAKLIRNEQQSVVATLLHRLKPDGQVQPTTAPFQSRGPDLGRGIRRQAASDQIGSLTSPALPLKNPDSLSEEAEPPFSKSPLFPSRHPTRDDMRRLRLNTPANLSQHRWVQGGVATHVLTQQTLRPPQLCGHIGLGTGLAERLRPFCHF